MKEQFDQLSQLIKLIPECNTYKSSSELNLVLDKYTKVLNYINGYNEAYKRATTIYFTGIINIRDNIQQSVSATSNEEKNLAFQLAKCELKADLHALSTLIQPQKETYEIPFQVINNLSATHTHVV